MALNPEPERLEGKVTQWSGSCGFILFSDGRRAFCHNKHAGGATLLPGQSVFGNIVPDERTPGKWMAQEVAPVALYSSDNSGRVGGTVAQWSGSYGFIQFSDGRRAFVHLSQCNGIQLVEGMHVVGLVVEDTKVHGKWQAQNVHLSDAPQIGTAPVPTASAPAIAPSETAVLPVGPRDLPSAQDGRLEGMVTQWSGALGFIHFSDGRRAICDIGQTGGAPLREGQSVYGLIIQDTNNPGLWQAIGVEVMAVTADQMEGQVTLWVGTCGYIQFTDGRRAICDTAQTGGIVLAEGDSVVGTVFADLKYRGKWEALDVTRNRSVALDALSAAVSAARMGTMVQVCAGCPAAAAAAQAQDIIQQRMAAMKQQVQVAQVADNSGTAGMLASYAASAFPAQGVASSAATLATMQSFTQAPAQAGGQKFRGTVAEWSQRGFGFILFDEGMRAYVHNSACGGEHLVQGEVVYASLSPDERTPGKFMAVHVERTGIMNHTPGAVAPPPDYIPLNSGTVAEWNPRGFGFISFDDGRRAYVHSSQCSGEHLEPGEKVAAVVVPDPTHPGKWQAQGVQRAGAGGGGPAAKRSRLA